MKKTIAFQICSQVYIHIYNFRNILSFVAISRFFPKLQILWYNVDIFHNISRFSMPSSSSAELC